MSSAHEPPEWELATARGPAPQPTFGHASCIVKERYFYVFGGLKGTLSEASSEFHVLDTLELGWRALRTATSPSPRSFATLNVLHDVITAAASVSVRCRAILPRNFAQLSDAGAATPGCRP